MTPLTEAHSGCQEQWLCLCIRQLELRNCAKRTKFIRCYSNRLLKNNLTAIVFVTAERYLNP